MKKDVAKEKADETQTAVSEAAAIDSPLGYAENNVHRTKKYVFFFKRAFDIILSVIGIIITAIPMLIIAIAIKCDSKGPAIFKTERVGKDCKPFRFYKFRSMRTEAPKDCAPRLLKSEDYITKVGAFLRKSSLDELPQLFCILKGDMSFVGPRPAGLSELDLIAEREKRGANSVTPGLTGLAQINGRDVLASNIIDKAEYDGKYAEKITLLGDLKIFFSTFAKVFKGEGIVEGEQVVHMNDQKDKDEKSDK